MWSDTESRMKCGISRTLRLPHEAHGMNVARH
jgi:hypothetical protein